MGYILFHNIPKKILLPPKHTTDQRSVFQDPAFQYVNRECLIAIMPRCYSLQRTMCALISGQIMADCHIRQGLAILAVSTDHAVHQFSES
ncbi:hypothetical protein J6590_013715 [Homalodisca vitripennis]|nr:hypothetical protein J6590_013715 [Homalodisca vitripennis]